MLATSATIPMGGVSAIVQFKQAALPAGSVALDGPRERD